MYRKYANGKSVFKIMSETSALELQLLGTRCLRHVIEATILPERQLIRDLLDLAFPGILVSDEEEFEATLEKCRLQDSSEN